MRYLLSGWIGHANMGDDLLLFCTVSGIQSNDSNAHITVLTYCKDATNDLFKRWDIHNVIVVQRLIGRISWRWQFWRLARCSDFYVVAGGGAIRDFSMAPNSVVQQYKMARIARFAGCKVEFLGIGAGPIWRTRSKKAICKLFRFARGTIRDSSSYDLLVHNGASKITHTADLVFSLPPVSEVKHNKIRHIGLVLRRWENAINFQKNSFSPDWGLLLRDIAELYPEAKVSLYCMQSSATYLDDDLGLAQSILDFTNSRFDVIELSNCTLDEVRHHFSHLDLLLSMRLHGLILGALYGCRLIGIEYDPKVSGLLRDLGLAEYSVSYADGMFENLKHLLGKVESQHYCAHTLHQKALKNFEFIKI